MRDYGKIYSSFWTSQTIRGLSDDGRLLAMYLMTSPHTTIAGVFRLPDGYVCEDLQWDSERVKKGFSELLDKGFADRCETTKWVWIRKHLDWNQPENPNQRKSAAKIGLSVPDECTWKLDFMRDCGELLGIIQHENVNTKVTLSEGFDKPLSNQEQEQEQEVNLSTNVLVLTAGESAPAIPDCPFDAILAAYHESLPVCPAVKVLNESRKKHIRARWRERAAAGKYADQAGGIAYFRRLFGYAAQSKFLTGQVNGRDRSPFFADLEFLMQPSSFARLIEGKYHQQEAA